LNRINFSFLCLLFLSLFDHLLSLLGRVLLSFEATFSFLHRLRLGFHLSLRAIFTQCLLCIKGSLSLEVGHLLLLLVYFIVSFLFLHHGVKLSSLGSGALSVRSMRHRVNFQKSLKSRGSPRDLTEGRCGTGPRTRFNSCKGCLGRKSRLHSNKRKTGLGLDVLRCSVHTLDGIRHAAEFRSVIFKCVHFRLRHSWVILPDSWLSRRAAPLTVTRTALDVEVSECPVETLTLVQFGSCRICRDVCAVSGCLYRHVDSL